MQIANKISKDFKDHKIIISILCIGMLPLLGNGYCGYILALLFPLLFKERIDRFSICIILFSLVYTFSLLFGVNDLTISSIIFILLFPIIMYQAGKHVTAEFKNPASGIFLISLMAICLALPAIVVNINDIILSGQLISPLRKVSYDEAGSIRSATGYGIMISLMCGCAGCLFLPTQKTHSDKILKVPLVLGFIGALLTTVHLINRTGLVLSVVSLFIILLLTPYNSKRIGYILSTILLLSVFFIFYIQNNHEIAAAIDFYSERNSTMGSSIEGAGGRDVRWIAGLQQIFNNPLGDPKGLLYNGRYNYAHNLVIDSGVKGGIICFVIMFYLVMSFALCLFRLRKMPYNITPFERYTTILLGVALILQCMTEPVIEALPQFFWYFLFFLGFIHELQKKYPQRL